MMAAETPLTEDAPAKLNLTLHVRGRRADGYHLLDSLVVFPGIADRLTAAPADTLTLTLSGPFGPALSGAGESDNLVLRAARGLAAHHGLAAGAALHLEKNLPLAAGIGGGSSDAAAALRLLSKLWNVAVPPGLAQELGADVPVCMTAPAPRMMSGIGEIVNPAPPLPDFWVVLANPGAQVPTGAVFAALGERNPPAPPSVPRCGFADLKALVDWLVTQRNDLQAPAERICPEISNVLAALADAPLARMSGSGATCFALFDGEATARACADRLSATQPWWISVAQVSR